MVHAREQANGLTLFYSPKAQYIVAAIVALFAAAFGFATYVTLEEPSSQLTSLIASFLGAIAIGLAAYAISSFRSGRQRAKHPKWLMRFTPEAVHVNLIHPGYAVAAPELAEQQLVIPLGEVEWIRQSVKPASFQDDADEHYVEMRVSDHAFQSAAQARAAHREAVRAIYETETETILHRFEGNVIRVLIEESRWPAELAPYWATHGYKVAEPFTIKTKAGPSPTRPQPRELF